MKFEKREFELLMLCVSLTLIFVGVIMQYKVIVNNNCKMPVIEGIYDEAVGDTHFFFSHKSEVKYYYFADIIPILKGVVSIGDIFILMGTIGVCGLSIRSLIKLNSTPSKPEANK